MGRCKQLFQGNREYQRHRQPDIACDVVLLAGTRALVLPLICDGPVRANFPDERINEIIALAAQLEFPPCLDYSHASVLGGTVSTGVGESHVGSNPFAEIVRGRNDHY